MPYGQIIYLIPSSIDIYALRAKNDYKPPATSNQEPAPSNQQPGTSNQHPVQTFLTASSTLAGVIGKR